MPFYKDSNELYSIIRATFTRLLKESPDHLDGLKSLIESKIALQLRTSNPAAEITLNARDKGFQAIYGPATVRPDLTVDLAADDLHRILLHELTIKKAWSAGQIKVKGPVWKLKVLTDLIQGAREYYPAVLQAHRSAAPQPAAKSAASKTATKKAGH